LVSPPPGRLRSPISLLGYINIIQHASLYLTRAKNSILSLQKKGQTQREREREREREMDGTLAAAAGIGTGTSSNGGASTRGKPIKCKGAVACSCFSFLNFCSSLSLLFCAGGGSIGYACNANHGWLSMVAVLVQRQWRGALASRWRWSRWRWRRRGAWRCASRCSSPPSATPTSAPGRER
jgi:hypothetical protein